LFLLKFTPHYITLSEGIYWGKQNPNHMPAITKNPIRIVILDSHTLFRAGMRRIIESQAGMEVVGEAGSLSESLEIITNLKPDIVLVELNLTGQIELDIITCLVKAAEGIRLILVTESSDPKVHRKAVENGVVGVVYKTQSPEVLIKAIEKVYAGEVWLERSLIANVLSRLSRNHQAGKVDPETDSITRLSGREKEVVILIGKGFKNKRISTELCISETTVRHHLTSIYSKLGVSDRLELLVYAHRNGLVTTAKK
jgi:two-component system nitrate/nitrite response regulator NarL